MSRRWLIPAGAVAALALAFAAGWWSKPDPSVKLDEHAEQHEMVAATVAATSDATAQELRQTDARRDEAKVAFRHEVTRPDGTHEKTELVASATTDQLREVIAAREVQHATEERVELRQADRVVDRHLDVEADRPDWKLTAMVGGALKDGAPTLAYGGMIERRMLGPISIGVWGLAGPVPTVGVAGAIDF